MDSVRLYILSGLISCLLSIFTGLSLFFILKIKFDNKIKTFMADINNELELSSQRCNEGGVFVDFNGVNNVCYVSDIMEWTLDDLDDLKGVTSFNDSFVEDMIQQLNFSKELDARIHTLVNTILEGGKKGDKGDIGKHGDPGPKGDDGVDGVEGVSGSLGIKGLKGAKGTNGSVGLKGDKGVTGEQGPTGPKGHQGDSGFPGLKGETGESGLPGFPGFDGRDGEPGEKGNKGFRGRPGKKE